MLVRPGKTPFEVVRDEHGKRKSPTIIHFDDDGQRTYGTTALQAVRSFVPLFSLLLFMLVRNMCGTEQSMRKPQGAYPSTPALLGQSFKSARIAKLESLYQYSAETFVSRDNASLPVGIRLNRHGKEVVVSPETLVAMQLQYARHLAEVTAMVDSTSGPAAEVKDVVLTVCCFLSFWLGRFLDL